MNKYVGETNIISVLELTPLWACSLFPDCGTALSQTHPYTGPSLELSANHLLLSLLRGQ